MGGGDADAESALEVALEPAHEVDRAGEVDDDAVAHHVRELVGGGEGTVLRVESDQHGEGGAQVDPDLQLRRPLGERGRVERCLEGGHRRRQAAVGIGPAHEAPVQSAG